MTEVLKFTSRALIGFFYQTLEAGLANSWMTRVAFPVTSLQKVEFYKWLGMPPALREWIGNRQAQGLRAEAYSIENLKFEATLDIEVDDLDRDQTGQIMVRVAEMADRVNEHREVLGSAAIALGNSALCYDGQPFFDTAHVSGKSGTQINDLAAAQVAALGVTAPAAPTPAEMAKAIMGCIGYFYNYLDDQGMPINGAAKEFLVMVPVPFMAPAYEAISGQLLSTGAAAIDNPLNALKSKGFRIDVVPNPLLNAWTDKFAIFRTDGRARPLIFQEEGGVKVSVKGEGSEYEHDTDRHQYGIKAKRNVGYGYWQHAVRATLS
jgi:phage major head subunit gpT-like protein